eukprot:TRINITY_DN47354_c0_g1_i1.p1 TRINITY_DN47354_c0_g1~~TRINITY_DN47354_c0_g1_i1.p1  ORF type:complete len:1868 (+),score=395.50 TRINITY_DN47354_c0_g1_i1:64-5667(+)
MPRGAQGIGLCLVAAALAPLRCVGSVDECRVSWRTCADAGQECVDPNNTLSGDWYCACVPPSQGNATGGTASGCVYPAGSECGACPSCASACASAGQVCIDPDATTPRDWGCGCVAPAVGAFSPQSVAVCSYDECAASLYGPNGTDVCSSAGQTCRDSAPTTASTGDWECLCTSPATGSASQAPATCMYDECTDAANWEACHSKGQTCVDPDVLAARSGDWQCRCPAPAVGSAIGGAAGCMFTGECSTEAAVCEAAGQTCADPSSSLNDWECRCVSPQVGSSQRGAAAVCALNECTSTCPTCAGTTCSDAGQTCDDADTSPSALSDWKCGCPSPSVDTATASAVAVCSYDECTVHWGVCAAAAQVCNDPSPALSALGDWQCSCAGDASGVATAAAASCTHHGECSEHYLTCRSTGQACYDPTPAAGDWRCLCLHNSAPAPAGGCILDECQTSCSSCASLGGNGTVCSERGQDCVDPTTGSDSSSLGDWMCVCRAPQVGTATAAAASCQLDECAGVGAAVCGAAGQTCFDPDHAASSQGDWTCSCSAPGSGSTTGRPSECSFPAGSECALQYLTCAAAGQGCRDASTAAGDWECTCLAPKTGAATRRPAACVLDECAGGGSAVCGAAGQTCVDGNMSAASVADWECRCVAPATGTAQVAGAAQCDLSDCRANHRTCAAVGQVCSDANVSQLSTGDWSCECIGHWNGSAVGRAAQCTYKGPATDDCTSEQPVCAAQGQVCAPSASANSTWQCECVPPASGSPMPGGAASCTLDECADPAGCNTCPNGACGSSWTRCVDPDKSPLSAADWLCECVSPSSGNSSVAVENTGCQVPECSSAGNWEVCYRWGQTCRDPDTAPTSRGDWECACIAPAEGAAVGTAATCTSGGDCGSAASTCSGSAQRCVDPTPTVTNNDWACECVPPAKGDSVLQGPASCTLDECAEDCPSCSRGTCGAAAQHCVDRNASATSLGDWECLCKSPLKGEARQAVAHCSVDECDQHWAVCEQQLQACRDPTSANDTVGDWQCHCVAPAVDVAPGVAAPAVCMYEGECQTCALCRAQCRAAGQQCHDPDPAVDGDWYCTCVPPANSSAAADAKTRLSSCRLDECSVPCRTCALRDAGAVDVCNATGQLCVDPNVSAVSLSDWMCVCASGTGTRTGAPVATCVLDECATELSDWLVCAQAGQVCTDPNRSADSKGDWRCDCHAPSTGSRVAAVAVCTHSGECVSNAPMCAALGQSCDDPTTADGDWLCRCVPPAVEVSVAAQTAAVCRLDECGNSSAPFQVCLAAGQTCRDPDTRPLAVRDWVCECSAPTQGAAQVRSPATCFADECALNWQGAADVCERVGQRCEDAGETNTTLGAFVCVCQGDAMGAANSTPAACSYSGGCSGSGGQFCAAAGQACYNDTYSDAGVGWYCGCLAPSMGAARGAAARCVRDECVDFVCGGGQTCGDPDLTASGDRYCSAAVPKQYAVLTVHIRPPRTPAPTVTNTTANDTAAPSVPPAPTNATNATEDTPLRQVEAALLRWLGNGSEAVRTLDHENGSVSVLVAWSGVTPQQLREWALLSAVPGGALEQGGVAVERAAVAAATQCSLVAGSAGCAGLAADGCEWRTEACLPSCPRNVVERDCVGAAACEWAPTTGAAALCVSDARLSCATANPCATPCTGIVDGTGTIHCLPPTCTPTLQANCELTSGCIWQTPGSCKAADTATADDDSFTVAGLVVIAVVFVVMCCVVLAVMMLRPRKSASWGTKPLLNDQGEEEGGGKWVIEGAPQGPRVQVSPRRGWGTEMSAVAYDRHRKRAAETEQWMAENENDRENDREGSEESGSPPAVPPIVRRQDSDVARALAEVLNDDPAPAFQQQEDGRDTPADDV